MSVCANITAGVEKLIVWHKALPTYIEGDTVYIEFNNFYPDIAVNGGGSYIVVQVGVTVCVTNVL